MQVVRVVVFGSEAEDRIAAVFEVGARLFPEVPAEYEILGPAGDLGAEDDGRQSSVTGESSRRKVAGGTGMCASSLRHKGVTAS